MTDREASASMQEGAWLQEAQAGSTEAFGRLVDRYESPVYAFVLSKTRNRELAQELAQETFVRAFEGLERFDPNQKFSHWLFGIAHHVTTEWRRRQMSQRRALEAVAERKRADAQGSSSVEIGTGTPVHERILGAIEDCPENYRLPLTMRYLDELSYEEIAEVLSLSPGQVKGLLYRGKQMLRERLSDLMPEGRE